MARRDVLSSPVVSLWSFFEYRKKLFIENKPRRPPRTVHTAAVSFFHTLTLHAARGAVAVPFDVVVSKILPFAITLQRGRTSRSYAAFGGSDDDEHFRDDDGDADDDGSIAELTAVLSAAAVGGSDDDGSLSSAADDAAAAA